MDNEKDIEILKSLYYGNHLNKEEIERASQILFSLDVELKRRIF